MVGSINGPGASWGSQAIPPNSQPASKADIQQQSKNVNFLQTALHALNDAMQQDQLPMPKNIDVLQIYDNMSNLLTALNNHPTQQTIEESKQETIEFAKQLVEIQNKTPLMIYDKPMSNEDFMDQLQAIVNQSP